MFYLTIVMLGIALSMDAFAVSICDGLVYTDIDKRKSFFIAGTFGIFQGVMPLLGFFAGTLFLSYIKSYVPWVAFILLLLVGGKMLFDGIKSLLSSKEECQMRKKFSFFNVLVQGFATSIDALAVGVSLLGTSSATTIWIHVLIIALITFGICMIGLLLGNKINRLLKGKCETADIIGGIILILIGTEILVSSYCG